MQTQLNDTKEMSKEMPNQPVIENETDRMFYEYVNSKEFQMTDDILKEFIADLNYTGDFSKIKTKEILFQWIGSNIISTNFKDINDAELRWQEFMYLENIEYKKFPAIKGFILNGNIIEVERVIIKWFPTGIEITTNSTCRDDFKGCTKNATSNYLSQMQLTKEINDINDKANAQSMARLEFNSAMSDCRNTYKSCVGL
ncbi:hypothetical protein AS589_12165 [Empedobacter brevis]|nr:hypothetical protein AS589_12165 [Empedobacter brevis]